ncbi:hypothetical protein Psch_02760 [Pelotomaculum schinkii]|uniref:ThiS family protein n=1 Tax=Pelotomaculum schinkii TaxID=78350 RepID=A0A4Y7RAH1_9FIRM|nr:MULTISPECIES: hypothetical protein [Pelotomaculum]TEB05719.1 hypothetical protein Psch_02760 [Pelotomaculum schinkii]TEB17888.1 hypothetical protein Psfp_00011 [Pelotomaculum sp. FP]
MSQNNFITVTLRSHVAPSANIKDFELGKPFQIRVEYNTTLEDFLQQLFFENRNAIGFIAINGKLAKENSTLSDGDIVYAYSLIGGG